MVDKKIFHHFFLILFVMTIAFAFSCRQIHGYTAPSITTLSSIELSKLYFNDDTGYRDVEITPWSLENHKLGGDYLYLITSYNTHLCSYPSNFLNLSSITKLSSCKLRQTSPITPNTQNFTSTPSLWTRDYYGAFSGHLLNNSSQEWKIYAINHGELLNNNYFPTQPCRLAPDIGYGSLPCTEANHTLSYNAFVGMSEFPWTLQNLNSDNHFTDLGPIAWPANGYVENGKKSTFLGILHPASIIKDNFIYVYYRDTSSGDQSSGRGAGLKLARAQISDSGINPLSFKTYFKTDFIDSALPPGFNKSNILDFFSKKGGRASSLFDSTNSLNGSPDVYSFSVAKIAGSNLYLGVAQDLGLGITLRFSDDLIHWSQETIVAGTDFNYFTGGGTPEFIKEPFMYPRLLNSNGDSNVEIDPNDFYIIGASNGQNPFNPGLNARVVNQIHLKLTSLPSKSPLLGDLNGDSKVNLYDYTKLIRGYGTQYTDDDFINVLANYGI